MDGRYIKENHDDDNVKGSKNQTLYHFKDNKAVEMKNYFSPDEFGLKVDKDNQVYLSGIPKENDLNQLNKYLAETGIDINFR